MVRPLLDHPIPVGRYARLPRAASGEDAAAQIGAPMRKGRRPGRLGREGGKEGRLL
jgi:hypothetical protein